MEKIGAYMTWAIGVFLLIAPWGYHIVYCFQQKEYVLLIAGAFIPPLGWLHGLGAFFGWW